ncbi:MAG: TetR/AcrR family transcriptional regulator [Gammaproteobacteria bacterium]|nr:TetR/AcrR family transcriptional regulator [Gammaproteobacteria bacterium]
MNPSKRETVLDTAEHLFYEEGFHATGIDRVVAEAGVARMTLYNHFPSKEALVESVLERRYRRYLDDLHDAVAGRGNDSAVAAMAERHNEWLRTRSRSGCILLKAIGEFQRHRPALAERGRELKRELLTLISEALSIDGYHRDEALAERVMMILEGANALAPVLGSERVVVQVESMLASVLGSTAERSS